MLDEEVAVTLAKHGQELKILDHRMDKLEAMADNINKLALSVERLAGSVSKVAESQKEAIGEHQKFNDRIEAIEKQPLEAAKTFKAEFVRAIIATVVGGIVGYLISFLG